MHHLWLFAIVITSACAVEPQPEPSAGPPPAAASPAAIIADDPVAAIAAWSSPTGAVAVVRVARADAFATAEPPFISTRYTLTTERALAGQAAVTVVIRGGVLGDRTVLNPDEPRLEPGRAYLGVFAGGQLVMAPPMIDDGHAQLGKQRIAVDDVDAVLAGGGS